MCKRRGTPLKPGLVAILCALTALSGQYACGCGQASLAGRLQRVARLVDQPSGLPSAVASPLNITSAPYVRKGEDLAQAAERYLRANMPSNDHSQLSDEFIVQTVNLSIRARHASVWATQVPEELWLNDVLPYAW